ncbi:MAG: chorismate-binding protein [Proteobacteria bacterium]|nr:chorismate-binding protein [Pseudomonadota bacterium]
MTLKPTTIAAQWPFASMPLLLWGANSDRPVLATAMKRKNWVDFLNTRWTDLDMSPTSPSLPRVGRVPKFIGVIPYETFANQQLVGPPPFVFEIGQSIQWQDSGNMQPDEKRVLSIPKVITSDKLESYGIALTGDQIKGLLSTKESPSIELQSSGASLLPTLSDDSYLDQIRSIITDIKQGKYYQLNLLRRFQVQSKWNWPQICERVTTMGGPFSALFSFGSTTIVSFSPEKFVEIACEGPQKFRIKTNPIKGTLSTDLEPNLLESSQKDRAELNMIVDLMRNDLTEVCIPKTVEVTDPGSLKKFPSVYHLEAEVQGNLNSQLSVGEIFKKILPTGSITGAPKIEVMRQIEKYEGQPRGYFMGNAFIVYSDGSFESNVLIRTMVSHDQRKTWSYAAGSGIVVKSDPHQELQEIHVKCRSLASKI